jgi:hypothetical protein
MAEKWLMYETKPVAVWAVKWFPAKGWRTKLGADEYGVHTMADDLGFIQDLHGIGTRTEIQSGDWIVKFTSGAIEVYSEHAFQAYFRAVPQNK